MDMLASFILDTWKRTHTSSTRSHINLHPTQFLLCFVAFCVRIFGIQVGRDLPDPFSPASFWRYWAKRCPRNCEPRREKCKPSRSQCSLSFVHGNKTPAGWNPGGVAVAAISGIQRIYIGVWCAYDITCICRNVVEWKWLYMLVVNKCTQLPQRIPKQACPPFRSSENWLYKKKHVLSNHTLNGPFVRFYDPHHPRHVNDGLLTMMVYYIILEYITIP